MYPIWKIVILLLKDMSMSELGVIDSVSLIQRRVINHQESDGSNKMVKSLNKFVTNAVAGTISQGLLETPTL
jgi:hypothetical protein